MKKILFIGATIFALNNAVKAQSFPLCDPLAFPSFLPTHVDSTWVYPEQLDSAKVGVDYYTVIYIKFPYQAEQEIAGTTYTLNVDSLSITSITNLPGGFSRKSDKYLENDTWDGGTYGCVAVYGNSNIEGLYTPIINVTAYLKFPPPLSTPFQIDTVFNNFSIYVDDTTNNPPLSIKNIDRQMLSVVYPNPANNKVFIELNNNSSKIEFTVTNLLGEVVDQQVYSNVTANNKIEFSTSNLSEGIYNYTIVSDSKKSTGKLMIIH